MASAFTKSILSLIGIGIVGRAPSSGSRGRSRCRRSEFANLGSPDVKNGETIFWAGGCESCHAAKGAEGDAKLVLAGARRCRRRSAPFTHRTFRPTRRPASANGRWRNSPPP